MKRLLLSTILLTCCQLALAQDLPAYSIFRGDSTPVSFSQMTEELKTADVILFGELHNNPISRLASI
ncbi:MAG: hypothetical protein U5L96_18305 [Owenweeksia sp.]|nr:hypothetical protein [Owenweeksia sp.]